MPGAGALSTEDDELLRRSAAGDRDAFDAFVERHAPAVLRFAGRTVDADRAEDILQETFLAAWRGAAGFRGGSARAWLFAIARNATRRAHRLRAGEPREHESLDDLALRAGWGADDDLLDRLEVRELVERGLGALSADDREILLMRELEGFGGTEAAAALGISLDAQKSRLHRARLRFIASLRGVEDEG